MAAEAGGLRGGISESLDQILRLSELAAFEDDEAGPDSRISVSAMKSMISRTQGLFLTASLLSSETALAEWKRLPEPAQHSESQLRNALLAELDRAAASLMDGKLPGRVDLDIPFGKQNAIATWLPGPNFERHRGELVRRLVTQVGQLA